MFIIITSLIIFTYQYTINCSIPYIIYYTYYVRHEQRQEKSGMSCVKRTESEIALCDRCKTATLHFGLYIRITCTQFSPERHNRKRRYNNPKFYKPQKL